MAIALVSMVAYGGSFDGEFVSDDIVRVRDNPLIRSLDPRNIEKIFTTFDGANYMPLKVLSLAIDYRLWGANPSGFHLTNLILHIGCALLIYSILLRLRITPGTACIVALLWAVHPLQVESVAWISERKNVLSGIFFLAAFRLYLDFSESRRASTYGAIVLLYCMALLSKMNTMVLPVLCLTYEMTFRFRLRGRHALAVLPLLGLAGMTAWYNLTGNPIHGSEWHGGSPLVTWLSSSVVVFRYLGKMLVPLRLAAWYTVPLRGSPSDPVVAASIGGIAAIGAITAWHVATRRPGGFWILWFWITLAPMLNIIVPFRSMMQDRYMYLPLLGPLALMATHLTGNVMPAWRRAAAAGAATMAVAACVALTVIQVETWTSPMTLWQHEAINRMRIPGPPGSAPRGYEEKVAYLRRIVSRDPSSAIAHNNLGGLYFAAGDIASAIVELEEAARIDPDDDVVLLNLGRAYARARELRPAAGVLERAVALRPWAALPRLHLGRVHLLLGDAKAARRDLEAFARLRPSAPWMWSRELEYLKRLEASRGP